MTTALLTANDLACSRDNRVLFSNVNFSISRGEILYVSGHNGSGKTSLLRMLCSLHEPSAGSIQWKGRNILEHTNFLAELQYIGHKNAIKNVLTVYENLQLLLPFSGDVEQSIKLALNYWDLLGLKNVLGYHLSAGQKQRLSLARLCISSAELWLLDEPLSALDHHGINLVKNLIINHVQKGGAVILTSHQLLSFEQVVLHELPLTRYMHT
jgi:heme exporter protein A